MNKYWEGKGKYQDKYEQIWSDHVPDRGECELLSAERFRCIARLYYDFYNNGWCNWDVMSYQREIVESALRKKKDLPKIDWSDASSGSSFYHPNCDDEKTASDLESIMDAIVLDTWQSIYAK